MAVADRITWIDDSRFEVSGVQFVAALSGMASTPQQFRLIKERSIIEHWCSVLDELSPRRIVELGIFKGGSTALLTLLADGAHVVAFDLDPDPVEALEHFCQERGLGHRLSIHQGVDQGDREAIGEALGAAFASNDLDLVIDDASHMLGPTRATFDMLFPRLRPGGRYLIEDWACDLSFELEIERRMSVDEAFACDVRSRASAGQPSPPLARLVLELVLASGYHPDAVAAVTALGPFVEVVRGPAALDPAAFSVSDLLSGTGRRLLGQ